MRRMFLILCLLVLELTSRTAAAKVCFIPGNNCGNVNVNMERQSLCDGKNTWSDYADCADVIAGQTDYKKCVRDRETRCYYVGCKYTAAQCRITALTEMLSARGATDNYSAVCITQGLSGCGNSKANPCCPYISRKCIAGQSEAGCDGYDHTRKERDEFCARHGYVCSQCEKTVYNVTCQGTTPTVSVSSKTAYRCQYFAPSEIYEGCKDSPLEEEVKNERKKDKYICTECKQTGYDQYKTCDGTTEKVANNKTKLKYKCLKQCVDYTGCDGFTLLTDEAAKAKSLGYTCKSPACSEKITRYTYDSYKIRHEWGTEYRNKYKCTKVTYGDCSKSEISAGTCEKCEKYPLTETEKEAWLKEMKKKKTELFPDSSYIDQGQSCTGCTQTVKHWNYKKMLKGADCKNGICDTTCDSVTPTGIVESTSTRPMYECTQKILKKTNCLTGYPFTETEAKAKINEGYICSGTDKYTGKSLTCTQTLDYYHIDSSGAKVADKTETLKLFNCVKYETSTCEDYTESAEKDSNCWTCTPCPDDSSKYKCTKKSSGTYKVDNNGKCVRKTCEEQGYLSEEGSCCSKCTRYIAGSDSNGYCYACAKLGCGDFGLKFSDSDYHGELFLTDRDEIDCTNNEQPGTKEPVYVDGKLFTDAYGNECYYCKDDRETIDLYISRFPKSIRYGDTTYISFKAYSRNNQSHTIQIKVEGACYTSYENSRKDKKSSTAYKSYTLNNGDEKKTNTYTAENGDWCEATQLKIFIDGETVYSISTSLFSYYRGDKYDNKYKLQVTEVDYIPTSSSDNNASTCTKSGWTKKECPTGQYTTSAFWYYDSENYGNSSEGWCNRCESTVCSMSSSEFISSTLQLTEDWISSCLSGDPLYRIEFSDGCYYCSDYLKRVR